MLRSLALRSPGVSRCVSNIVSPSIRHVPGRILQASIRRDYLQFSSRPLQHLQSRLYSSEASAPTVAQVTQDSQDAQDAHHDSAPGPITRYADLEHLGVHASIINSIVHGMGYETMTDVQAMTIAPALRGKDM
jgi:ATP-dependent RNA helicase MSS116, mitochondrial